MISTRTCRRKAGSFGRQAALARRRHKIVSLKNRHLHLHCGFPPLSDRPGCLPRSLWPRRRPQFRQVGFRPLALVDQYRILPRIRLMEWIPRLRYLQQLRLQPLCSFLQAGVACDSPESSPTLFSTAHGDSPPDLPALPSAGRSSASPAQAPSPIEAVLYSSTELWWVRHFLRSQAHKSSPQASRWPI